MSLSVSWFSIGRNLFDEFARLQNFDCTSCCVFRTPTVESNRFHSGPAHFFLTCAAFQVTVDRKLYRRQVVTEDGIAHLKKSFSQNRHWHLSFHCTHFLPLLHQNSYYIFIRERKSRAHRNDIIFDSWVTVSWCDFHAPGDSVEIFHSTPTGCRRTPLLGAASFDFVPSL